MCTRFVVTSNHKMKEINDIIRRLKFLDLTTYPYDEIRSLIHQFGRFGAVQMQLHPGKTLIRSRPNEPGQRFTLRSELAYKPQVYNIEYQRASTPNMTMFYGGTIPEDLKKGELDNARIVSTLEASNLLRDTNIDGEQTITFSKWIVTKDIHLFAVCHYEDFVNKSSHTKELYEAYNEWTKNLPPELLEKSLAITTFLATEFAKKEIRGDFDYMISAIFSQISVEKGLGGIYYPSVRVDGMGYNVAIAPQIVDTSLKLVASGECKMYKKGNHTIVDNEMVCTIDDDKIPFMMNPVATEYHMGRDKIMEKLNMV